MLLTKPVLFPQGILLLPRIACARTSNIAFCTRAFLLTLGKRSHQRCMMSGCGPCAGYVPADKPGSLGYYTPPETGAGEGSMRHPVIAALDQALTRDPQRHRTSSLSSSTGSGSVRTSIAHRTSFAPIASHIGSPTKARAHLECYSYNYYTHFLPRGEVRLQTSCMCRMPKVYPLLDSPDPSKTQSIIGTVLIIHTYQPPPARANLRPWCTQAA